MFGYYWSNDGYDFVVSLKGTKMLLYRILIRTEAFLLTSGKL